MRRIAILIACLTGTGVPPVPAQDTLPPSEGGMVRSLGLPELYKPYLGTAIGVTRRAASQLTAQLRLGVYRDISYADTELLGWSAEYRVGWRNARVDHGPRAMLVTPMLGLGAGVDYSVPEGRADLLFTLITPVRRGGVLGRGTDLRLEWLPTHRGAMNLVFTVPLRQPARGTTRPLLDYAALADVVPRPVRYAASIKPPVVEALEELAVAALWIGRYVSPRLRVGAGEPGRSAHRALEPLAARLDEGPEGRTVDSEIRAYHAALSHAFALVLAGSETAARSASLGDSVAAVARDVLLHYVLLPYDRLLGQRKRLDTTGELARRASGMFARRLVTASLVPASHLDAVMHVFQQLTGIVEQVRRDRREAWGDSRLVWLPLQLALLPEQYDEQEELDSLVSRAVGHPLTHGNRIWYVHNDRFQLELIRSIRLAEDYHVLWVHDFRGLNSERRVDSLSVVVATEAYLATLRERVLRYDSTGRLPVFMLFLDQHYFEVNKSRALLNLMADPLGREVALTVLPGPERAVLLAAQRRLREAVAASPLLQAEAAQYGETWLHGLVKVHVNVTNPADPSFRSQHILPLIGVPDDVMRDHRKIVLYDVSEADPYRGMAVYTGMGVGEHYAGRSWEDRAIMLQGPAALALRDQARGLLETQGLRGNLVPHVLRPQPMAPDYAVRVRREIDSLDQVGRAATRAIELHNSTGFATKEISVANATLFSLLPPGVLKIPDSLWLNEFLASLMAGAALRGVQVLLIMPGTANAPSGGWPAGSLMHDLAARVLVARQELARHFDRSGGLLQLGLYDAGAGVDDLGDRVRALRRRLADTPFLRDVYAFDPSFYALLDSTDLLFGPAPAQGRAPATVPLPRPKLHFKGFLYLSRQVWNRLIRSPVMTAGARDFLMQRVQQLAGGADVGENSMADAMQRVGAELINPMLDTLPTAERNCRPGDTRCGGGHWVLYFQIGSPNLDYRSMVMDGEAAVLISNWTSLYAVPDFVLLTGLTAWINDQSQLDSLRPPHGGPKRALARWIRMML